MSDAYFEITAQRLIKIKPKMVRLMINPYYLCYMEEADAGEARWNAAETGFKNFARGFNAEQCQNGHAQKAGPVDRNKHPQQNGADKNAGHLHAKAAQPKHRWQVLTAEHQKH